jgi:hypothetical protein
MRRALASLKYVPSLVMGLLALVWVLSLRGVVVQYFQWRRYGGGVSAYNGSVCCFIIVLGSFAGFRFPLWSYFAYTALVAAELAYYLRA